MIDEQPGETEDENEDKDETSTKGILTMIMEINKRKFSKMLRRQLKELS